MSLYLIVNDVTFEPLSVALVDGAPPSLSTGTYYDTGRYGPAPSAGAPFYDEQEISFDKVDGVYLVRKGFRHTAIFATLVIAGSPTYCNATCKTLLAGLRQLARYTVELPGGTTYPGCKLRDCGTPTWENMSGGCLLVIPCIWAQRSLAN